MACLYASTNARPIIGAPTTATRMIAAIIGGSCRGGSLSAVRGMWIGNQRKASRHWETLTGAISLIPESRSSVTAGDERPVSEMKGFHD